MPVVRLAMGASVSPMKRLRTRTLGRYLKLSSVLAALTVSAIVSLLLLSWVLGALTRLTREGAS